jgi:hypothetical protein
MRWALLQPVSLAPRLAGRQIGPACAVFKAGNQTCQESGGFCDAGGKGIHEQLQVIDVVVRRKIVRTPLSYGRKTVVPPNYSVILLAINRHTDQSLAQYSIA